MAQWEIMQAYGLSRIASTHSRQELTDAPQLTFTTALVFAHILSLSHTHTNKIYLLKVATRLTVLLTVYTQCSNWCV